MDQEQFNSIVAQLRGLNSSGTLNTSDLSILQNAILGVLTDTYTPAYIGKTTEQLQADYAPNFFAAEQTGDPILQRITADIAKGFDLWTIKQNVKAILENDPNVTGGSVETQDYLNQAETYYREWNAYNKAQREDAQAKIENDPFAKYGLPAFDERYQAIDFYKPAFEKLAKDYANQPYKSKQKKYPPGQMPGSMQPAPKYTPSKITKTNAPEDYAKIAEKNVDEKGNELIDAERALQEFIAKNPDTYDLKYQTLLEARDNARQRYSENVVGAVGLTGAPNTKDFKTSDMLESLAKNQVKEKTKTTTKPKYAKGSTIPMSRVPFDEQKARLAGNTPERMERVAQAMIALLQPELDALGITPLKDALTTRGIFSAAANIPKSSSKPKNYTVKGSQVIKSDR